jgi:hypothetical protein
MTYVTGGLIQASDYNGFNGNVNATWNSLYGQTAAANVSTGGTVTATQWATLNTNISSMASHQATSITSRSNPTTGQVISVLANVATDITSCTTNQYNAGTQGSQFTGWTGTASATSGAGSGPNPWTITYTDTITFANATAASNFFNAGATVKIQFSKTSTGTVADTEWNAFIPTCGTIYLSSTGASKSINGVTYTGTTKVGGSGSPSILTTSTGFAQLSSSPTIIFKQFDVGTAYSSNYVQVTAAWNGSTNLTVVTTWYDNGDYNAGSTAQISGGTGTTGITFGTAPATVVTYFPPETTYLTNTWGSPSVAATISVT